MVWRDLKNGIQEEFAEAGELAGSGHSVDGSERRHFSIRPSSQVGGANGKTEKAEPAATPPATRRVVTPIDVPCPACGHDLCPPSCPTRIRSSAPPRFEPERSVIKILPALLPAESQRPLDRIDMGIAIYRAYQLLEVASARWLELREHAMRDGRGTSPTAIRLAEEELHRAAARVRDIRRGKT